MKTLTRIAALVILQSTLVTLSAGAQTTPTTPASLWRPSNVAQHFSMQPTPNWLQKAVAREAVRLALTTTPPSVVAVKSEPQAADAKRGWIKRHPSLFGSLVGFGAGFLVGYLPGDDAVFDDYTAEFNGLVIGGIGAGVGAVVGWASSHW